LYIYRRWRFSPALCRWHTFFGTTVIVSSSLHIALSEWGSAFRRTRYVSVRGPVHVALIATSRYQLIVHPRFHGRWLSSAPAVASQIVFAWLAAVLIVLPGVVGVPTKQGNRDISLSLKISSKIWLGLGLEIRFRDSVRN